MIYGAAFGLLLISCRGFSFGVYSIQIDLGSVCDLAWICLGSSGLSGVDS